MIGLHNILTSKKGCKHVSSQVLWVCFSQSTQQAWEWVKPPLLEKFTKSLRATHGLYQKDYHRAQKMHNSKCTGCPSLGCSLRRQRLLPCAQGQQKSRWSPQHHTHPSQKTWLTPGGNLVLHWPGTGSLQLALPWVQQPCAHWKRLNNSWFGACVCRSTIHKPFQK